MRERLLSKVSSYEDLTQRRKVAKTQGIQYQYSLCVSASLRLCVKACPPPPDGLIFTHNLSKANKNTHLSEAPNEK